MNTLITEKTLERLWTVGKYKVKKKNCAFLGQLWESKTGIKFLSTVFPLILHCFVKQQEQYLQQPCVPGEIRNFLWPLPRRGLLDCLMLVSFWQRALGRCKDGPDTILKSPSAMNRLSLCLSTLLASAAENFWKLDWPQGHRGRLPPTGDICHDCPRGVSISESVLADPPANPGCHPGRALLRWALSSTYCFTKRSRCPQPASVAHSQQLRLWAPGSQRFRLHSYENLSGTLCPTAR